MSPASTLRMAALALLWGSGFLWIKSPSTTASPPPRSRSRGACWARLCCASWPARPVSGCPRPLHLGHLVVAALFCNAIPFALFAIGEQTVDSGIAGVLNATTPLWSPADRFPARHPTAAWAPYRLTGLALGFAGTVLIFAPWHRSG